MKKLMSLIACVTALAFITPVFAQDEGDAPKKGKKVKKAAKKEGDDAKEAKKAPKKAAKKAVKKAKKDED
jgi:hypothetical protein